MRNLYVSSTRDGEREGGGGERRGRRGDRVGGRYYGGDSVVDGGAIKGTMEKGAHTLRDSEKWVKEAPRIRGI